MDRPRRFLSIGLNVFRQGKGLNWKAQLEQHLDSGEIGMGNSGVTFTIGDNKNVKKK